MKPPPPLLDRKENAARMRSAENIHSAPPYYETVQRGKRAAQTLVNTSRAVENR
jgi:hypothetical protein